MEFAVKTFYFTQIDGSIPHGCLKILISPDEKKKSHAGTHQFTQWSSVTPKDNFTTTR
jgi:hypothetical protein